MQWVERLPDIDDFDGATMPAFRRRLHRRRAQYIFVSMHLGCLGVVIEGSTSGHEACQRGWDPSVACTTTRRRPESTRRAGSDGPSAAVGATPHLRDRDQSSAFGHCARSAASASLAAWVADRSSPSSMALVNDLIHAVGHAASLSPEQAESAVGGALRFLASRLPSPLFGELQARLNATPHQFPDEDEVRRRDSVDDTLDSRTSE